MPCGICQRPGITGNCPVCQKWLEERERPPVSGAGIYHYFVGNRLLGTSTHYCCGYADAAGRRHSGFWPHEAFFCPTCGEIWARITITHQFQYQPIPTAVWDINVRPCERHGGGLLLTDFKDLSDLPLGVLRREVELLLQQPITTRSSYAKP